MGGHHWHCERDNQYIIPQHTKPPQLHHHITTPPHYYTTTSPHHHNTTTAHTTNNKTLVQITLILYYLCRLTITVLHNLSIADINSMHSLSTLSLHFPLNYDLREHWKLAAWARLPAEQNTRVSGSL
jgi:hypothetical protein